MAEGSRNIQISYGTAGFRSNSNHLTSGMYSLMTRTAFYASLRARHLGKSIGIMITASHNPIQDNGVKLIDPNGYMVPTECEQELDKLVNELDDNEFDAFVRDTMSKISNSKESPSKTQSSSIIIIATDTRPSSPELLKHALKGCELAFVPTEIFENHTTPQLHFIVRSSNEGSMNEGYVSQFNGAINYSLELVPLENCLRYQPKLFIDCANGVGSLWIKQYFYKKNSAENDECVIDVELLNNDVSSHLLNFECGADFVKIEKKPPTGFEDLAPGVRCASLDGDADRLIYFYKSQEGIQDWRILDGDHIAALFLRFILEQYKAAENVGSPILLKLGIVQTAYANGNSTRYFTEKMSIAPVLVKTGVKHLEEAARKFDIGVYFEANGHGTVCFSQNYHDYIASFDTSQMPRHIRLLHNFSKLVNEVVGDGIADILAVEMVLRYFDWSIQDWEENTYTNLPNTQLKIPVIDRSAFQTHEEFENVLVKPIDLQNKINSIVQEFKGSRAFIRPSGTEQLVRIYAEANSQSDVVALSEELAKLIKNDP